MPSCWNTLFNCARFLLQFKDELNIFIAKHRKRFSFATSVYNSSLEVEVKLEQLDTDFSLCVLQCFRKRYSSTADIILSKPVYLITLDGLTDFRSRDSKDKTQITNQLKKKFMDVASKLSTNNGPAGTFLPVILHHYLNYYQFEKGDNPFLYSKI